MDILNNEEVDAKNYQNKNIIGKQSGPESVGHLRIRG